MVRVTAEQEQRLSERAAARRITIPRLLVEAALTGQTTSGRVVVDPISQELAAELFGVNRLLDRVSVNVNQLAKVANATGEIQPGTGTALEAIVRVSERLAEVADRLDPEARR